MAEIFREIDEELREERLKQHWKRYGKYLIAGAVILIVGLIGYRAWDADRREARMAEAVAYAEAVEAEARAGADAALHALSAVAQNARGGFGLLAQFRTAALQTEQGDVAGAVATYERIAADGGVDPLYRSLAELLLVMAQADSGDAAALLQRIEAQTADGEPWRYTARELAAALSLRLGDYDRARQFLIRIVDDQQAPAGARRRAAELLETMRS